MISIRGAITVDEDIRQEVISSTKDLLSSIIEKNNLEIDDIVSIFFSCTNDIKSVYPAVAAREMGILNAGLMCFSEMFVEGSLKKCIRVLMLVNKYDNQKQAKHVYMKGAAVLRPDLIES